MTSYSNEVNRKREERVKGPIWKSFIKIIVMIIVLGTVLFISSGKVDWVMAWIYIAIIFLNSAILILILDPELIIERTRTQKDIKRWDIKYTILIAWIGPTLILIIAGLDVRYQWSPAIPAIFQIIAVSVGVLGLLFSDWAIHVNKFFSAVVRIQKERGHTVISSGPYQIIRHPGYAGGIIFTILTPIALGALWSYIPAVLTIVITVIRTAREDKTLYNELSGYSNYGRKVPYKLLPGIW